MTILRISALFDITWSQVKGKNCFKMFRAVWSLNFLFAWISRELTGFTVWNIGIHHSHNVYMTGNTRKDKVGWRMKFYSRQESSWWENSIALWMNEHWILLHITSLLQSGWSFQHCTKAAKSSQQSTNSHNGSAQRKPAKSLPISLAKPA